MVEWGVWWWRVAVWRVGGEGGVGGVVVAWRVGGRLRRRRRREGREREGDGGSICLLLGGGIGMR